MGPDGVDGNMAPIRRLVLDVLKPHDPDIPEFARRVSRADSVDALTVSLVETDREVQNLKLTVEGTELDPEVIERQIETLGGSVHSIDEVSCGEFVVTERKTPQD
jgi:hypothetical protein